MMRLWISATSLAVVHAGADMEVVPITGLVFGIEHVTNPNWEEDEEEWYWAYVISLGIIRISVIKYK